jgi:hypothetical protein
MPELVMMQRWLDNWAGVGLIATGMERSGSRLHLTNAELGIWRATSSRHAMASAESFGGAATPWGAKQEAAWDSAEGWSAFSGCVATAAES